MELFTTATLWKNYDRRAQPLDVTVIDTEEKEGYSVEYVFFNGDPCADGCARICAHYYRPDNPNGAGVVLMNDVMDVFDETYVKVDDNGKFATDNFFKLNAVSKLFGWVGKDAVTHSSQTGFYGNVSLG